MTPFGLTDQGFLAPRAVDLKEQIRTDYEAETGLQIDWDVDVFLGVLSAVVSERQGQLAEMLQAVADARDPGSATGAQLDAIASIVGVTRIPAAFSRADLTVGGDAGTAIPIGSEVEHPNGTLWQTTDDVEIGAGGTAQVEIRPGSTGAIPAPAASWEIVTPVDGWDSATTSDDASVGRDREPDSALRLRRQESLQIVGGGTLNAIRSNVLEVEGVTACVAIDNDTVDPQTVGGLSLNPKSIAVVVFPDTITDAQTTDLVRVIYDRAPAGVELMGSESATVVGLDGFEKAIRWFFASEFALTVDVEYTGEDGLEEDIEDEIEDYFAGLGVGETVRLLAILGRLAQISGVNSATVELNGFAADVSVGLIQVAVIGSLDVTQA